MCLRIAIGTHTSAAQQNACTISLPAMLKGYEMIPLTHLAITTFGRKELDLVSDGVGLSRPAKFLLGFSWLPSLGRVFTRLSVPGISTGTDILHSWLDWTAFGLQANTVAEHVLLRLLLFAAETFKENLEDIVELLRDVGKAQHCKFLRPIAQCRLHPFDPAPMRRHPHLSVMSSRAVGQHFYLEEPWLLRGG